MEKARVILQDAVRAFLLGLVIGVVILAAASLIGAVCGGLSGALEASRGAVLLAGGFMLLFSGILMLKGGNLPPETFQLRPWKKKESVADEELREPVIQFHKLPRQYVFALVAIGVLTTSLVPECIILYIL